MKKLIYILFLLTLIFPSYSQHWEKITTIPAPYNSGYYLDIFFLPSNPNYGWACGFDGYVIRTRNYGQTWQGTVVPDPAYHLESIHFVTTQIGFVSGVEGIWKSTDGGASFFDITPKDSALRGFWGTYFLDENIGVVVGGGCDDMQRFYKTTNGGVSWTLFKTNVPNTGLTDLILYPSGIGYAVSSGYIWRSIDFGSTWSIFKGTGATVWQEEISIMGNSIVLPYAGVTCSGGGNTGGMTFSTDFGNTWKTFQSGYSMFGACLVSETSAWACGYGRSVYYTSNSGQTWVLRNCGITGGDMDDITFLSETEGWVCGHGIYKLKPTTFNITKNQIDFGELCAPDYRVDSLKVINSSFFLADMSVQISNNIDGAFTLVSPKSNSQIYSCDSGSIVIKFSPNAKKTYNAKLLINLVSADGKTVEFIEVDLVGVGNKSTIRPEKGVIVIDSLSVGVQYNHPLKWFADEMLEQIKSSSEILNDKDQINFDTKLPLTINTNGTTSYFSIKLQDTGWVQQNFRFNFLPCNNDTLISVRAYGYSPIINSIDSIHFISTCRGKVIRKIPVWNTGNSNLIITSQSIVGNQSLAKIIGWTSGKTIPVVIPPKERDSAIVEIEVVSPTIESYYLKLNNNDRTTIRGNKDPINILLVAKMNSEDVKTKDTIINFGNICLNTTKDTLIKLENKGNIAAYLKIKDSVSMPFSLIFPWNPKIEKNDYLNFSIKFTPQKIGPYSDTLIITTGECGLIRIIILGNGVFSDFALNPNIIKDIIKRDDSKTYPIDITNIGNTDITISKLSLNPPSNELEAILLESLPLYLQLGQAKQMNIQVKSKSSINYSGEICFEADSYCPTKKCVPIEISSLFRFLVFGNKIEPKTLLCEGLSRDTVLIINRGTLIDTISSINLDGDSEFRIISPTKFPLYVDIGDTLNIIVEFQTGKEGVYSTMLNIQSIGPEGQLLTMPLSANFKKTTISISQDNLDFGISESCDEVITKQVIVTNTGLQTNEITILPLNLPSYLQIKPSRRTIEGNSQIILEIQVTPKLIANEGVYTFDLILQSSICPQQIPIQIIGELHNPKLLYSTKFLDFQSVEVEEYKVMRINIENQSKIPRKLSLSSLPQNDQFQILTQLPIEVFPNETKYIDVKFQSYSSGTFIDKIELLESSSCTENVTIELKSIAPNEFYTSKVWIGEYLANVDEDITIDVNLTQNLRKLYAKSLEIQISFDEYLFYPRNVQWLVGNKIYENKTYEYSFGKLNLVFDEKQAQQILNNQDVILKISGKVLASVPTQTPLKIDKFEISTNKAYSIQKQNGLLKLNPFCTPEVSHKIYITAEPQINITQTEDNWYIKFYNLYGNETLEIYNLVGVKIEKIFLTKDTKELNYDVSNFPSGLYFIRFNEKIEKIIK